MSQLFTFLVFAGVAAVVWKHIVPGARGVPWGVVALLALGCVGLDIDGQVVYAGVPQTTLLLAAIGVVLLLQVANRVEDLLVRADLLPHRLDPKYGILLPIALVAAAGHTEWSPSASESWRFTWGHPNDGYAVLFVLTLWVVVKLGRILRAVRAAEVELEEELA